MLCKHIFGTFNFLQIKTIQKFKLPGTRWTRQYQDLATPGIYDESDKLGPELYAKKFLIMELA